MVIFNGSIHCICDFPLCKEELIIPEFTAENGILVELKKEDWSFRVDDSQIGETYCKLHKHRIPREDRYELLQS